MSRLRIVDTPLAGVKVVERGRLSDSRGFLSRMFCAEELHGAGWDFPVAQINHTLTRRAGAVRGMHYQHAPRAEIKLVSCLRGEVWDVAVDLRRDSPTFLQWFAQRLSPENGCALLIPRGVAHGFQALVADCELLYIHSHAHHRDSEGAIHPADPRVAIAWPQDIAELSARDNGHPFLMPEFQGIAI